MRTLLALFTVAGLAACAHSSQATSTPTSTQPPACPVVAAGATLPAEDAALRRWKAIVADDFRPPAGTAPASLVPELVAYLASVDPERRDTVAYSVLDRWIGKQVLSAADVRALAERLLANLRGPLDAPDGVYGRSFSALVLASIVERDAAAPVLSDAERRTILAAARDYAHRETDLRGHTGARGWAHAAAHTADLLAQLAKLPALTDDDRAVILDAIAGFVVRRHGQVLHDGEDGRLGVAVVAAAKAGLAPPALTAWLAKLKAPLSERFTPAFDAGHYAAYRNARNLLFTLYVQLSLMPVPSDGQRRLLEAVRTTLAD
ncbi:MAG TPA: DUF2785 domain-containing protein [Kofleriaceae bacterium]|nr:DUF2785 domain-containing protein [Kofleriaceae bacterium]